MSALHNYSSLIILFDYKTIMSYQTVGVTGVTSFNNLELAEYFKIYIEDTIMRLKKSYEENWDNIIIYKMILNLINFIKEYFNNPTEDRLKIVDWYFIDLIINKDKIIVRGFFYELGIFIEDKVLSEGLLELESRINKIEV